jgi:hypothetical protein
MAVPKRVGIGINRYLFNVPYAGNEKFVVDGGGDVTDDCDFMNI